MRKILKFPILIVQETTNRKECYFLLSKSSFYLYPARDQELFEKQLGVIRTFKRCILFKMMAAYYLALFENNSSTVVQWTLIRCIRNYTFKKRLIQESSLANSIDLKVKNIKMRLWNSFYFQKNIENTTMRWKTAAKLHKFWVARLPVSFKSNTESIWIPYKGIFDSLSRKSNLMERKKYAASLQWPNIFLYGSFPNSKNKKFSWLFYTYKSLQSSFSINRRSNGFCTVVMNQYYKAFKKIECKKMNNFKKILLKKFLTNKNFITKEINLCAASQKKLLSSRFSYQNKTTEFFGQLPFFEILNKRCFKNKIKSNIFFDKKNFEKISKLPCFRINHKILFSIKLSFFIPIEKNSIFLNQIKFSKFIRDPTRLSKPNEEDFTKQNSKNTICRSLSNNIYKSLNQPKIQKITVVRWIINSWISVKFLDKFFVLKLLSAHSSKCHKNQQKMTQKTTESIRISELYDLWISKLCIRLSTNFVATKLQSEYSQMKIKVKNKNRSQSPRNCIKFNCMKDNFWTTTAKLEEFRQDRIPVDNFILIYSTQKIKQRIKQSIQTPNEYRPWDFYFSEFEKSKNFATLQHFEKILQFEQARIPAASLQLFRIQIDSLKITFEQSIYIFLYKLFYFGIKEFSFKLQFYKILKKSCSLNINCFQQLNKTVKQKQFETSQKTKNGNNKNLLLRQNFRAKLCRHKVPLHFNSNFVAEKLSNSSIYPFIKTKDMIHSPIRENRSDCKQNSINIFKKNIVLQKKIDNVQEFMTEPIRTPDECKRFFMKNEFLWFLKYIFEYVCFPFFRNKIKTNLCTKSQYQFRDPKVLLNDWYNIKKCFLRNFQTHYLSIFSSTVLKNSWTFFFNSITIRRPLHLSEVRMDSINQNIYSNRTKYMELKFQIGAYIAFGTIEQPKVRWKYPIKLQKFGQARIPVILKKFKKLSENINKRIPKCQNLTWIFMNRSNKQNIGRWIFDSSKIHNYKFFMNKKLKHILKNWGHFPIDQLILKLNKLFLSIIRIQEGTESTTVVETEFKKNFSKKWKMIPNNNITASRPLDGCQILKINKIGNPLDSSEIPSILPGERIDPNVMTIIRNDGPIYFEICHPIAWIPQLWIFRAQHQWTPAHCKVHSVYNLSLDPSYHPGGWIRMYANRQKTYELKIIYKNINELDLVQNSKFSLFKLLWKWVKRRHNNRSSRWIFHRYWYKNIFYFENTLSKFFLLDYNLQKKKYSILFPKEFSF